MTFIYSFFIQVTRYSSRSIHWYLLLIRFVTIFTRIYSSSMLSPFIFLYDGLCLIDLSYEFFHFFIQFGMSRKNRRIVMLARHVPTQSVSSKQKLPKKRLVEISQINDMESQWSWLGT